MDLQNIKKHMQGARVTVCGCVYQLDGQGITRNVPLEHARRLLLGKDWRVVHPEALIPGAQAVGRPAEASPVLQAMPETPWVPVEPPAAPEAPVAPVSPPEPLQAPEAAGAGGPPPLTEDLPQTPAEPAEFPNQEPPAGASIPDWPEPTADMRIGYLKDMAAAYGVQVPLRVSKVELVKLIQAARVESDGEPELTVE